MTWVKCSNRLPTKEECALDHGWFMVYRRGDTRVTMSRYDGHEEERSYDHGWKYTLDAEITHWKTLDRIPKD